MLLFSCVYSSALCTCGLDASEGQFILIVKCNFYILRRKIWISDGRGCLLWSLNSLKSVGEEVQNATSSSYCIVLMLETKPRTIWNSWSAPNLQFQSYLCQAFLFPFVYLPVSTSPGFVDTLSEFRWKERAITWMFTCSEFIHALQAGFILFTQIMACLIWQSLLYIKAVYIMNLKAMPPLIDRLSGTFNYFSGLSNTLLNTYILSPCIRMIEINVGSFLLWADAQRKGIMGKKR